MKKETICCDHCDKETEDRNTIHIMSNGNKGIVFYGDFCNECQNEFYEQLKKFKFVSNGRIPNVGNLDIDSIGQQKP